MRAATALLLVLALGACADMPVRSAVQSVAEPDDVAGSTARYAPGPPTSGASPGAVVRGWLDAMLAYPVSRTVAEQFLTPAAAQAWRPSAGTEIYSTPRLRPGPGPGGAGTSVELVRDVGSELDARGRRTAVEDSRSTTLRLQEVDGEWRIADPPDGLLVTEKFAADYVRPFSVYFFDRPMERLVPDLVHLVVGDTLPTSLVTSLAAGPTDRSGAVRTVVPDVSALRPSVPVSADGVADVEFVEAMEELDATAQQRASAQLVWTLRQLDDVTGVRLLGASALRFPGTDGVQSVDTWGRYGPREPDAGPWAVVDGALAELRGVDVREVPDADGVVTSGASMIAVGGGRLAQVLADGDTVRVTDLDGGDGRDLSGAGVSDISWPDTSTLVVLDRPGGSARIRVAAVGAGDRTLPAPGLGAADALRFSPEGGRYVALVDDALVVGAVVRDEDGDPVSLGRPRELGADVEDVRSPVWLSGTRIAFLAATDVGSQVHSINIDGSDLRGGARGSSATLPDVDAQEVAVGPGDGRTQWVRDVRGRLWFLTAGGAWSQIGSGRATSLAARG